MIVFNLTHEIDTTHRAGWLWYSHDTNNPPTDRQVVHGNAIIRPSHLKLASWYFLSDAALQILNGSPYSLFCGFYDDWRLSIEDHAAAAMFKLKWM